MAGIVSRIFFRNITMVRTLRDSLREPLKTMEHGTTDKYGQTAEMWKKIFYFVCAPSIGLCVVNVLLEERPEPPEFKPYEHLRIRTKRYPWGDGNHSLFHNPHTNALPDGYETH